MKNFDQLNNFKKDIEALLSLYDFKLQLSRQGVNEYKNLSYQDLVNDLNFEIIFLLWRKYNKVLNMEYFNTLRTLKFVSVAWDNSEHNFTLDINYDILFKEGD